MFALRPLLAIYNNVPFVKGKSGNPKGRQIEKLADKLAQQYGPRALEIIASIMNNSEEDRYRLDAAKYLADRAYGKAKQEVDVKGTIETIIVNVRTKERDV